MKEILVIAILLITLALSPIAIADTNTASTTGTVTLESTCGISATGPLEFGAAITGIEKPVDSDPGILSTITNEGSTSTTNLQISGTEWLIGGQTSSTPISFTVGSTHYDDVAATHWNLMDVLTSTDATIFGHAILGNGESLNIYFRVKPPLGVDSGNYEQTITFTSTC